MTRKTSDEIASIAAKWLGMTDHQMQVHINDRMGRGDTSVLAEIREMAGSCLSQVEEDEPDWDIDDPRWPAHIEKTEEVRRSHIPWTDLVSSNLKRCRFDPVTSRLDVEFLTGASGSYADVPADLAAQLAIAESPGKFLNANLKGKFAWTRNPPPATGKEELRRSVEEG